MKDLHPERNAMKILWITGDWDYAAQDFEEHCTIPEVAEQLVANGESKEFKKGSDSDLCGFLYCFEARLLEFGDIDPKFIKFVHRKVMDYDQKKAYNFYVVDE